MAKGEGIQMIKLTKYELRTISDRYYFVGFGCGMFVGLFIDLLNGNKLGYWISALVGFILIILLMRWNRRKLL